MNQGTGEQSQPNQRRIQSASSFSLSKFSVGPVPFSHWLIAAAATFNFVLAMAHARGFPTSEGTTVAAQLAIEVGAVIYVARNAHRTSWPHPLAIVLLVAAIALGAYRNNSVDLRFMHDILVLPLFLLVGRCSPTINWRFFAAAFGIILLVGGIEVLAPEFFVWLANPLSYYAATRPWVLKTLIGQGNAVGFYNGLYVGSVRASGNALGTLGEHRAGSIFLEPLSFAYFSVLSFIYSCARPQRTGFATALVFSAACLGCVLADTRTALAALALIAMIFPLLRRLPPFTALLVPALIAVIVGALAPVVMRGQFGSELAYRIGITSYALDAMSLSQLVFGGAPTTVVGAGDSAVVYIMTRAGLLGLLALALVITWDAQAGRPKDNSPAIATFIFFSVVALFGGAFLSIKTASIAGFFLGFTSIPRTHHYERTERL